ncbi:ABC transporter permease [Bifidobacterium simiiventris]|uniref:ABC transporter permease n=1 Tax=Bifidobacterium simiiventris TaxID=2834434 RepID=UPI001C57250B|nr:ABC transporter permease [Bifidobacterium simiiventris]MBW3078026.1 ABC transporter permease [Bifidobacterium simiiventris]
MLGMIVNDLRLTPLRTALTAISMLIGILALIASVLIGTLGTDYLQAVHARMNGREPTWCATINGTDPGNANADLALMDALAAFPDGAMSVAYQQDDLTVRAESNGMSADMHAEFILTDAQRLAVFPMNVDGGWLTDADGFAPVEVVANRAASNLIGRHDGMMVIGMRGSAQQVSARINGVANDGASDARLYVNAASLATFAPQLWSPQSLLVYWHGDELDDRQVVGALNDMLADTIGGVAAGWSRVDGAQSYASVLLFLQVGTEITALLLLLVSAIGLVNIGLSGIEQRSRELLIRRALGATRTAIAVLVVGSSLLLGILVAAIGIAISAVLVAVVPPLLTLDVPLEPSRYPTDAALAACLAACATSLFGSLAPAIKAARLQPALALR